MRFLVHCIALSFALVAIAGCSSDPVSPNGLPVGTAQASVSGKFAGGLSASISQQSGASAIVLFDPPRPTDPHPFAGLRMLYLHWHEASGATQKAVGLTVALPYDFGALPYTVAIDPDTGYTVLSADPGYPPGMGLGGSEYHATSGTVTITTATDSTVAGTLDLMFGPTSQQTANLHATAAFNARRCYQEYTRDTCPVF